MEEVGIRLYCAHFTRPPQARQDAPLPEGASTFLSCALWEHEAEPQFLPFVI